MSRDIWSWGGDFFYFYLSEWGGDAFFTARVAKRVKVMFSQASVCPTLGGGGRWSTPKVNHHPPGTWSTTTPSPPGHGQPLPPPPGTWSTTTPSPQDMVNHYPLRLGHGQPPPPPPGTWSTTTPPGTWSTTTPPLTGTWSTTTPLEHGQPPPLPGTWSTHYPPGHGQPLPPPPTWDMVNPPHHDSAQAGGMHPTGMHSCFCKFLNIFPLPIYSLCPPPPLPHPPPGKSGRGVGYGYVFGCIFFCKFLNIFPLPLYPLPPPHPLVWGQGSKVRGLFSWEEVWRWGVGVRYMSSELCFWIDFEFPEGVWKAGSQGWVSYIHTHALQTRLVALCWEAECD